MRPIVVVAAVLVALVLPAPATAVVLDPPVQGPVLARFHAPTPFGAGHRGVDLGAPPGTRVRASAAGRVTFAGRVVDATWVTVDHGGVRTTVGPLSSVAVDAGQQVWRGTVLGTSGSAHGHPAVHWSARVGTTYVDPLAVGRLVATLVPGAGVRLPPSPGVPRRLVGRVR